MTASCKTTSDAIQARCICLLTLAAICLLACPHIQSSSMMSLNSSLLPSYVINSQLEADKATLKDT